MPVLNRMIREIPEGSTIWMASVGALGHNLPNMTKYLELVHKRNCVVKFKHENIDSHDPTWLQIAIDAEQKWKTQQLNKEFGRRKYQQQNALQAQQYIEKLESIVAQADQQLKDRIDPEIEEIWERLREMDALLKQYGKRRLTSSL